MGGIKSKTTIMNIALINNAKVENIIVADLEFARQLGFEQVIDVSDQEIEIGFAFNGESFSKTQSSEKEATERYLSQNQMLKRFTVEEFTAILSASKANVLVEYWLVRFNALKEGINLNDPETLLGLQNLEEAGLLVQGRANEILQP
jgi:hypothetical protein